MELKVKIMEGGHGTIYFIGLWFMVKKQGGARSEAWSFPEQFVVPASFLELFRLGLRSYFSFVLSVDLFVLPLHLVSLAEAWGAIESRKLPYYGYRT